MAPQQPAQAKGNKAVASALGAHCSASFLAATGLAAALAAQAPGAEAPQRQRETILRLLAAAAHEETLRLELMEPVELLEPPTEGLLQALERCEVLAHPKLGAPITTMELARC